MAPAKKQGKGISLWTLLLVLLGLALVSVAALGTFLYLSRSQAAKAERKLAEVQAREKEGEVAKKEAAAAEQISLAQAKQGDALVLIRSATNSLERLLQRVRTVNTESLPLWTNDLGRALATNPELALQASRFLNDELTKVPKEDEVATRLLNVRRLEEGVLSSAGSPHEPSAEIGKAAESSRTWAEGQSEVVALAENQLAALKREAKVRGATGGSVTLQEAVTAWAAEKASKTEREQAANREAAKAVGAKTVAEAEATRILEQAKLKAEAILAEAKRSAEATQRELSVKEAESRAETAKTEALIRTKDRETLNAQLREKASDLSIQAKLAPFITPGYLQVDHVSIEKKPHSYSLMKTFGALEPTGAGLERFVGIGATPKDKVRPRWRFKRPNSWKVEPQELEEVKEAQRLLIELGPVLVEMKLLEE